MRYRHPLLLPVILALPLLFPQTVGARPVTADAASILQRSMRVMQPVRAAHSESSVHVTAIAFQGRPAQSITAHNSVDCTGTHTATRFTSAIRATITGTAVVGKGAPQQLNTRYIILGSGTNTGAGTHYTFWERDAGAGGRWRVAPNAVQEEAFSALDLSQACPTGGYAYRLAAGAHLQMPVAATSAGRPVWAIAGTSGSAAEHFTFRILVDRRSYHLDGLTSTYVQRLNGRVLDRHRTATVYSGYGRPITITAPKAGSTSP